MGVPRSRNGTLEAAARPASGSGGKDPHPGTAGVERYAHGAAGTSVGCEHTLEKDINRRASVIIELYHAAVELVGRLEHKNFRGNTLTLKIKFHDFSQITRSITQSGELTTLDAILPLAKQLLKEVDYEHHPIRLIGLSVSNPREENDEKGVWEQLSFEFRDWEFDK